VAVTIRAVDYFYVRVNDRPGEACRLLSELAEAKINLLAFGAIPAGSKHTQLVIFPESSERLARAAENLDITFGGGSHHAFLIQGDDRLGSLVEIHKQLADANINIASSNGVSDGRGGFGYVLYVSPEDYERAALVLGL
jgi:prephenate dehydratase